MEFIESILCSNNDTHPQEPVGCPECHEYVTQEELDANGGVCGECSCKEDFDYLPEEQVILS